MGHRNSALLRSEQPSFPSRPTNSVIKTIASHEYMTSHTKLVYCVLLILPRWGMSLISISLTYSYMTSKLNASIRRRKTIPLHHLPPFLSAPVRCDRQFHERSLRGSYLSYSMCSGMQTTPLRLASLTWCPWRNATPWYAGLRG